MVKKRLCQTNGVFQDFIGQALYENREYGLIYMNLETGGMVEVPDLNLAYILLKDSLRQRRRVLLAQAPTNIRQKPIDREKTLEELMSMMHRLAALGERVSTTKGKHKKINCYEPLAKEQYQELEARFTADDAVIAFPNPFSYQPNH